MVARAGVRWPSVLIFLTVFWCFGVGLAQSAPSQGVNISSLIQALRQTKTAQARGAIEVWEYFPPNPHPYQVSKRFPLVPVVPQLLKQNFSIKREAVRLESSSAWRYTLVPKFNRAPIWYIWLDDTEQQLLGFEQISATGEMLRKAWRQTKAADKPNKANRPTQPNASNPAGKPSQASPHWSLKPALEQHILALLPSSPVPSGFHVVGLQHNKRQNKPTVELIYSDGLNVLPVVISPQALQPAKGIASRRIGNRSIWLIGLFPESDLQDILNALPSLPSVQDFKHLPNTPPRAAAARQ